MRSGLIVFDGDDTLWETEPLYDRARSDAARIAASVGIDPSQFEELQREIDLHNVSTMGLSATRFPTSSVQAFTQLAERAAKPLDQAVARRVYDASAAVFAARAPLLPHAEAVVEELARSYRIALLTKGDEWVQNQRVDSSGLRGYFDYVSVVPVKDVAAFQALLDVFGESSRFAVSIGNSMPSDIAPALKLGMLGIWIDAHVWVHELREHGAKVDDPLLCVAGDLAEIPAILARAALQRA